MLVLGEHVRIPDRGVWRVEVPLRLRVARNASALSLRAAIEPARCRGNIARLELAVVAAHGVAA